MPVEDQKKKGLLKYHGITAGTVTASKALVVDSNKDLSSLRNLTITGTFTSGTIRPTNIDLATGIDSSTGSGTSSSVTMNAVAGKVVTPSMTSLAGAVHIITITNSFVASGDLVLTSMESNSAGTPILQQTVVGSGTITITIYNAHATVAFNSTARVTFLVIKA